MLFKQLIQSILLGFAIWFCLSIGVGQNSMVSANLAKAGELSQSRMPALPKEPLHLESEVDRFLTSIPSGYYTIANVTGLKSLLENHKTVLVDVREASEYRLGHIPNAINIPLRTLTHNLDKIPHNRSVVLYCSSGYRSAMGVMTLHLLGYDNVRGFPPSFAGWKSAGAAVAELPNG